MSGSIKKITVYKIKDDSTFEGLAFSGYTLVSEDTRNIGDTSFEYKLFFLNRFSKTPDWFDVFSDLDIANDNIPTSQTAGFILVVKLSGDNGESTVYAFSGGIGHIRLRESLAIEPRFGVILAEKILSLPELKGLTQKDTSGVVNFMDRVFRTTYNPEGDVNNLRRILTNVRGKLSEGNRFYNDIGKSILAGNALSVTGAKTFGELLSFLVKVDDLWRNGQQNIRIPQLRCIVRRYEPDLIGNLENKLVEDICSMPNEDNTLFLDNEEMGYLPDRITKYELSYSREKVECETYSEVFVQAGRILNSQDDKIETFHRLHLEVIFDDGTSQKKELFYYICGDVILGNEYYFINNKLWYKANDEYMSKLSSEIDNVVFINPDVLGLSQWDNTQHSGLNGEFRFNQSNASFLCLDHKLVSIDNQRGGVEFCDLLKDDNGIVRLIHVKNDCGAALRNLFAQGFVSSQLYAEDAQFQEKVHTADLRREGNELTDSERELLASLSSRYKNQFEIIYAIYDDTTSHKVPANPQKTSEWLNGTLTTFAKVDLLNRVSSMRAMGFNVAITRIRPFPQ